MKEAVKFFYKREIEMQMDYTASLNAVLRS